MPAHLPTTMGGGLSPSPYGAGVEMATQDGGKRHGASVKQLKRVLKKAGLKTTGRKAALTRRAKKAHLKLRGGEDKDEMPLSPPPPPGTVTGVTTGGRRRSRRSRGKLGIMGY